MIDKAIHKSTGLTDLKSIRSEFPILHRLVNGKPMIYLDNAASSQKPNRVLEAMEHYYTHSHANVHRGVHTLSQEATDLFEGSRQKIADYIGAPSASEVIFTRGTTESINLIAYTFGYSQLNEGDEVILSEMEHHSNIVPWQIVCKQKGAVIRVIPVHDDGTLDLEWLKNNISDKTRLVSVTHVSNTLGTINPIRDIIRIAHAHEVPVMLDGAQAAPHLKINVQELDVDFYALSSHKMYGPTGMGVLYGKALWLDGLPPWHGGGEMIKEVTWKGTTFNSIPFKFEAGTPDIAGAIGMAAACAFLDDLNVNAIATHEHHLLNICTEAMTSLPGLRPIGTAPDKAGVFSFVIEGLHPYDIGTILDQQGVEVRTGHHCTQPLMDRFSIPGTVRASFAAYNTLEEIETLFTATQKAIKILS